MPRQPKRWKWTKKRDDAVLLLAEGYTQRAVAEKVGVSLRTVERWCGYDVFDKELDDLTLTRGIAGKAARVRIAKRVIRQNIQEAGVKTKRDLLDWLKFVQSETDGITLNFTAFFEETLALAGGRQGGDESSNDSAGDGADTDA